MTISSKVARKTAWFATTARNALAVVASASLAFALEPTLPSEVKSRHEDDSTFVLTGAVRAGLSEVGLPVFSTEGASLRERIAHLGSSLAVVPLVAVMANVAIARAFGKWNSIRRVDHKARLG